MNENIQPKKKVFDKRFTILISLQVLILIVAALIYFLPCQRKAGDSQAQIMRETGNRLQAAGMTTAAAEEYERFLNDSSADNETKAKIAYSLGLMYESEGLLDKALAAFYKVELFDSHYEGKDEVGRKVVALLERLGKFAAAKRELHQATSLEAKSASDKKSARLEPLAKIGNREIYQSDVDQALDLMPENLRSQFLSKEGKQNLLKKIVADELLAQKAERLEYDKQPEFISAVDKIRSQLLVQRLLNTEFDKKIKIDSSDLENYFKANNDRYKKKEAKKPPQFSEVKAQVEADYRREKAEKLYQDLITEALTGADVKLFMEKVK